MKIEHFAINVTDAAGMAQWWAKNLDLTIIRADKVEPFIHFLSDDGHQTLLEIYTNPKGEFPDYANQSIFTFHIAFAVEDIEAEIERLLAAGAQPSGDILTMPNNDRLGFVRDPWGVCIQILQRATPLIPS
ncbi:MAG: VOC family protein [Chloroflexota bacterium]